MTIQEAIKSGKKFKRPFEDEWWEIQKNRDGLETPCYASSGIKRLCFEALCVDWLLAEDWIVEEEKIEITKSQLESALEACCEIYDHLWTPKDLAIQLGFKS